MSDNRWNIHPTLKVLLLGSVCPSSPLRRLRGLTNTILRFIYEQYIEKGWTQGVRVSSWVEDTFCPDTPTHSTSYEMACMTLEEADFRWPKPQGLRINMMPIMWKQVKTWPAEIMPYRDLIMTCVYASNLGEPIYITIDESEVERGQCQRRPGLHTEAPGSVALRSRGAIKYVDLAWGGGYSPRPQGGLFIASSVTGTTRVYNALVTDRGMINPGGDVEYLRPVLGAYLLPSHEDVIWLTDQTPHESLPMQHTGMRQFFRLVSSDITAWYSRHSTANPMGTVPGKGVHIIDSDKFHPSAEAKLGSTPVAHEADRDTLRDRIRQQEIAIRSWEGSGLGTDSKTAERMAAARAQLRRDKALLAKQSPRDARPRAKPPAKV